MPYPPALVERLLTVIAGLNADLDHDVVLRRVCRACVELLEADAAAFLVVDDEEAKVVAGVGLSSLAMGLSIPATEGLFATMSTRPRRVVFDDFHAVGEPYPDVLAALGDLHTLVVTPVQARNQLVGALVVMFAEIARPVTTSTTALLDLLAGHGGAAIANALAFEAAVRRQAHEKAVIDAVADGVATLDGYGLVSGWNRAAAELTGRSANEAFGRPPPFPVGTEDEPVEHRFGDR